MVAPKSTVTLGAITGGSSLVINAPENIVEGDVLVAFIRAQGNGTPDLTPPSGWTRIGIEYNGSSGGRITGAWAKTATSSEPSSYTFTVNARAVGGISLWSGDDVSLDVVGNCIDYRGWWNGDINGRTMDEYVSTDDSLLFVIGATEAVEGVPHIPAYTPSDYTQLFNHQTGSGTTGSRTAIWVGYRTLSGPVSPETEVLVPSAGIGWTGTPSGEVTQGVALKALSLPVEDSRSPFLMWDSSTESYVDHDIFVWDDGSDEYVPIKPVDV